MELTTTTQVMHPSFNENAEKWVETARRLYKLQKEIKNLEADAKLLSDQLKHLSGGESTRGDIFLFEKTVRKGTVNYKNIPELKWVNLDMYRSADVESWKLTLDIEV